MTQVEESVNRARARILRAAEGQDGAREQIVELSGRRVISRQPSGDPGHGRFFKVQDRHEPAVVHPHGRHRDELIAAGAETGTRRMHALRGLGARTWSVHRHGVPFPVWYPMDEKMARCRLSSTRSRDPVDP